MVEGMKTQRLIAVLVLLTFCRVESFMTHSVHVPLRPLSSRLKQRAVLSSRTTLQHLKLGIYNDPSLGEFSKPKSSRTHYATFCYDSISVISAVSLAMIILTIHPTISQAAPLISHFSYSAVKSSVFSLTNQHLPSWFASLGTTGFYQAFSLVFFSELGDKTFFIAALLAMKMSRLVAFTGSIAALSLMTVVSVLIGQILHLLPSLGIFTASMVTAINKVGLPLEDILATIAFATFGIVTLRQALAMDSTSQAGSMEEEFSDAKEQVKSHDAWKQTTAM